MSTDAKDDDREPAEPGAGEDQPGEREPQTFDDLVEVYFATNPMEANRAIVEVLTDMIAFRRDRVSHALPAPDTEGGGYFIAVEKRMAEEARKLLSEALEDGALDRDHGRVLG